MENLLDLTNQVETQPLGAVHAAAELVEIATTTQPPADVASEAAAPGDIEEIDAVYARGIRTRYGLPDAGALLGAQVNAALG